MGVLTFPLSPCILQVPKAESAFVMDGICYSCTAEGWVMIPNTLPLNQNTKVINFMLENGTEFNNLLCSHFFKKEVTNTAQFVAVNICLFLRKASHHSSCKNCRLLYQLPGKTFSMIVTLSVNLKEKQPLAQKNGRVLKHVLVSLFVEGALISKNLCICTC